MTDTPEITPEPEPEFTLETVPVPATAIPVYDGKGFALDLLIGLAVLLIGLLPGALLAHFIPSGGIMLAICGIIFFIVAALRARTYASPWMQGLGIGLGAGVPVAAVIAFASLPLLPMGLSIAALLLLVCIAGAFARRFYNTQQIPATTAIILCAALVCFAAWHYAIPRMMTEIAFKRVDKPSPTFTLTRLDGTPVTLDSLKGKVVVLDFWATWCEPCQAEMPTLLTVYRQFQNNPNVVYIAVATGWNDDTDDKVRTWITRKRFPFPVALDPNHAAQSFQIQTIPTQVILDRYGHIRLINTGYQNDDEALRNKLTAEVQELLAK